MEKEEITGSGELQAQSAQIGPAAPPHTYFGVAQALMPGVKLLACSSPIPAVSLALLCSHALECLLKAYLSGRGIDDEELRKGKIRHDLSALWDWASIEGLEIQKPKWVDSLSVVHKTPYHLRYATGIHGIVVPGPEPMSSDLTRLLGVVREQLK
jgi:hypothetical protein